ncbi:MAG: MopE-related protein, partial [Myxococcota bacterium]
MTEPIPRHDRAEVTVGVFPSDQLSGEISLQARGYVGCEEPLLTNEESAAQTVAFGPGVRKVTLVLTGADSSSDADRDGYRAAATGGPDCDDANPEVHPGQTENCTNGIDDDCSQTADCADPSCANASCASGDLCTTGAVCTSERVCAGTLKACNTPPGECHQSQGSCDPSTGNCQYVVNVGGVCSTGICRSDGVCVPPNTEVLCGDGLDNDGDNQTDCLDPDCDAQTCSDGNLCTTGDSCTNSACAPGTPVTCTTPPSACFVSPG